MKTEIDQRLSKIAHPTAFLATIAADGAPQVRPITLMTDAGSFYLGTSAASRKVEQIQGKNRIEFVTLFSDGGNTGYLRVTGSVERITDAALIGRVTVTNNYPVTQYWESIEDPDFYFCKVIPERVEYMRPGDMSAREVTNEFTSQ